LTYDVVHWILSTGSLSRFTPIRLHQFVVQDMFFVYEFDSIVKVWFVFIVLVLEVHDCKDYRIWIVPRSFVISRVCSCCPSLSVKSPLLTQIHHCSLDSSFLRPKHHPDGGGLNKTLTMTCSDRSSRKWVTSSPWWNHYGSH
jgi:hypothetical protein